MADKKTAEPGLESVPGVLLKEYWFWRGETIAALQAQGVHIGSQMVGGRVTGIVTRIEKFPDCVVIDVSPQVGLLPRQVVIDAGGWGVVAQAGEYAKALA